MIGVNTTFLIQLELADVARHAEARQLLRTEVSGRGETIALSPRVINEFIHVATDPRRFQYPLSIQRAIDEADKWWNAAEVQHIFPTSDSTRLFLQWLRDHRLGRKRLLDTELAAVLWAAGVRRIVTSNARDIAVFGFEVLMP